MAREFEYRAPWGTDAVVRGTLYTPQQRLATSATMLTVYLPNGITISARWQPCVDPLQPFVIRIRLASGKHPAARRCANVYDAMEAIAIAVRERSLEDMPDDEVAFAWLELPWCA
jgi:hypothetical protein